jgi:uncharacterized coiled-coil DUF342 family protein
MQISIKGKTHTFQNQIVEKQGELAPWLEKRNEINSKLQVSESEFVILNRKINEIKDEVDISIQKITQLQNQHEDKQDQNKNVVMNINKKEKELQEVIKSSKVKPLI